MVREPNLKKAVEIIRNEFKAFGIELPYQKTLEVVAKSQGFSGYEHYLQSQARSKNDACAERADSERPFKTEVVFGDERVKLLRNGSYDERMEALNEAQWYSFKTEAELDAFLEGINEASGWLDSLVLTPEVRAEAEQPDPDGENCEDVEKRLIYASIRVRAYLPDDRFVPENFVEDSSGHIPVGNGIQIFGGYKSDLVTLEEIPYRSAPSFVGHNPERKAYVVEFTAQVMFEAISEAEVEAAMPDVKYEVTFDGVVRLVLESEIIDWKQ